MSSVVFKLILTHISNKFSQHWRAAWNQSAGGMRPADRGLDSTGLGSCRNSDIRRIETLQLSHKITTPAANYFFYLVAWRHNWQLWHHRTVTTVCNCFLSVLR